MYFGLRRLRHGYYDVDSPSGPRDRAGKDEMHFEFQQYYDVGSPFGSRDGAGKEMHLGVQYRYHDADPSGFRDGPGQYFTLPRKSDM